MSQEFQNSSLVTAVGASAVRGERMQNRFRRLFTGHPALTSAAVSLGFLAKAFLARRFCLEARASGIPQVMATTSLRPGQLLFLGPLTGIVGGVLSGVFAHSLIGLVGMARPDAGHFGAHPIALAFIVAALGYLGHGPTCGTGYETTRSLFSCGVAPVSFGRLKFVTALATALSGAPRAIFAPSLQVGAGIGRVLADLLPVVPQGSVVLSAMTAHANGVVHLPMTAAITIREMTADVA